MSGFEPKMYMTAVTPMTAQREGSPNRGALRERRKKMVAKKMASTACPAISARFFFRMVRNFLFFKS